MRTRGARQKVARLLHGRFSLLLPLALVTLFWWPSLVGGKVLIHGDSALVGLPLLRLLSGALHGHGALLWCSHLTGGHPLLAEGQGGFLNPVNVLAALFFAPEYGIGLVHWLSVTLGAAGVFCLCRILEIHHWSATFASIAVAFSGVWIASQHNLPISATLAWAPWLLAAVEHWLRAPSLVRGAVVAVPATALVFAGYPQITYGATVYALTSLVTLPFGRSNFMRGQVRTLLGSGACAALFAAGLSAVQWLPLYELAELSHRHAGTDLTFGGAIPPDWTMRGLFYFYLGSDPAGQNLPSLGNISVLTLFGLVVFIRVPARILGHLAASLLLFSLGMGLDSPVFRFIYAHHLLHGLHSYRTMHGFYGVAVIGIVTISASVLDGLSADPLRLWQRLWQHRRGAVVFAVIYIGAIAFICKGYYAAAFHSTALCTPALLLAVFLGLASARRRRWLPIVVALVLCADAVVSRTHVFNFYDKRVLVPPELVVRITQDPVLRWYRIKSMTGADGMTFLSPTEEYLPAAYRKLLVSFGALPSLQWNVSTFDEALALSTARWKKVSAEVRAEALGANDAVPGRRLMDLFGIRYVAIGKRVATPGLLRLARDAESGVFIYQNTEARPIVQLYRDAVYVDSPESALKQLRSMQADVLYLEATYSGVRPRIDRNHICASTQRDGAIHVEDASSMRYVVTVDVACPAWLFLADANYPDWEATVNGARQPIFTAQLLGKAIPLQSGYNRVSISYEPHTFRLGLKISVLTAAVLALVLARGYARRKRGRSQPGAA